MEDFFNLSDISAQNEDQLGENMKLLDIIDGKDDDPPVFEPMGEIPPEEPIFEVLEP